MCELPLCHVDCDVENLDSMHGTVMMWRNVLGLLLTLSLTIRLVLCRLLLEVSGNTLDVSGPQFLESCWV